MNINMLRLRKSLENLGVTPLAMQEGVSASAPPDVVTSPGLRQIGAEMERPPGVGARSGEDEYAYGVPGMEQGSTSSIVQQPGFSGTRQRPEVPPMERTEYKPVDIEALRAQLYTPQTQASDRFNKLLDTAPERGRPGIARRIAASATMFGGDRKDAIGRGEQFMYAPYIREAADWAQKVEPYGKAAQFENTANVNERTLATQIIQREQENERLRQNERKIDISAQRQRLMEMKYRNPNLEFDFSGPVVMVSDPSTGEVRSTGVRTGEVDEMTRIDVTGAWRVKEAQEAGINAQRRVQTQQEGANRRDNPEIFMRGDRAFRYNPDTQKMEEIEFPGASRGPVQVPGTPPRPTTGGSETNPLNVGRDRFNKAQELKNFDSKGLGRWIRINRNGTFTVQEQGRFSGPSDEEVRKIKEYIGIPENENINGGQAPAPSSAIPPNATHRQRDPSTGKERYSTDGKDPKDPTKVWIEVGAPQGRAESPVSPSVSAFEGPRMPSPNMMRGRNAPLNTGGGGSNVMAGSMRELFKAPPHTQPTGKGAAGSVAEGGAVSNIRGQSALAKIQAEEEERRRQARR